MSASNIQIAILLAYLVVAFLLNWGLYADLNSILKRWHPSTYIGRFHANFLRALAKMYPYLAAFFAVLIFGMLMLRLLEARL